MAGRKPRQEGMKNKTFRLILTSEEIEMLEEISTKESRTATSQVTFIVRDYLKKYAGDDSENNQ